MNFTNGQFLFMAEAEGLDDIVDTETARINAVVKELRRSFNSIYDITCKDIQTVAMKHGFDSDSVPMMAIAEKLGF